jgi:hypothetical protein
MGIRRGEAWLSAAVPEAWGAELRAAPAGGAVEVGVSAWVGVRAWVSPQGVLV